ncbi:Alkaline exonuclease [Lonomia obliqua multiple nucleopolyhedrovirus]|uniref:Alkaline exonuclease n=1 Tax=Lonomia obliqua multiple nucleopolyhedrovirus TaxID=134394 RepID=A0A126FC26_9ABAC|nr:Alkaline exonuclease [Lonomia obliqua multiple nucleopolyhedrovirus]AKN80948.1 Alkaline exonuclease [Lonomia obliqua multiple nucleopolyhedrovirus]
MRSSLVIELKIVYVKRLCYEDVMFSSLTAQQSNIFNKYKYENYIKNIKFTKAQQSKWISHKIIDPIPIDKKEIFNIEMQTRGQSKNNLWMLLRLDRKTASLSCNMASVHMLHKPALVFGNKQENEVKCNNALLFECLREKIRLTLKNPTVCVVETVLNCGMFLSELGLHAASPDAYFRLNDETCIPVEIKCPYNYRDTTVGQMRNGLGANKLRYRVKHTALSVNRIGNPMFAVEKTDPHYRQMQRQMYVMKAPMCFYVVKFKRTLVVSTVLRDNEFCEKEQKTESNAYVAFGVENLNASQYQNVNKRIASFTDHANNHIYTAMQINKLAIRGIYINYGYLKCAFCNFSLDSREPFDDVIQHAHANCKMILFSEKFYNSKYFDHEKRYASIAKNSLYKANAKEWAYYGYYLNSIKDILKCFSCGTLSAVPQKHDHKHDCQYYLEILKSN